MGNTNGGGGGSWRSETVTSADYYKRPLSTLNNTHEDVAHHGVVVHTKEGNSFLIHHPGPSGTTTVTPTTNMSAKW